MITWLKELWADLKVTWGHLSQEKYLKQIEALGANIEPEVVSVVEAEVKVIENKKGANMGWLSIVLNLIPYVVAGVQALHPTEAGTTKKQIATNLINIAAAGAIQSGAVTGQNAQIAAVTAQAISSVIDATVQQAKATGQPNFTPSATDNGAQAAPAAAVTTPVGVTTAVPVPTVG